MSAYQVQELRPDGGLWRLVKRDQNVDTVIAVYDDKDVAHESADVLNTAIRHEVQR